MKRGGVVSHRLHSRLFFIFQFVFHRIMSSTGFTVKRICSAEEVAKEIILRGAVLGLKPGALDHVSYYAADETGHFVGELYEKIISCLSVVKYTNEYAFVSQYIVDKPYRGKGYGLLTWKYALSSLPDECNCALDAVMGMASTYIRSGFKPEWNVKRVIFRVTQECSFVNIDTIKPADQVPFSEILQYDTSVHVYARPAFLQKWISASNCLSYAAVNQQGSVVGYTVVRSALRKEDGWIVGPLFANNSQIARSLYQAVMEGVAAKDPDAFIAIDVPHGTGCHPESLNIATVELSGVTEVELVRMYTKGVPPSLALQKVFGQTALGVGL